MKSGARSILLILATFAAAAPVRGGSISGRILDSSAKPVAGARVTWSAYRTDDQVLLDRTAGAEQSSLGETASGPDGRFRIALEKLGIAVSLRISPPGLSPLSLDGPFDPTEDVSVEDLEAMAAFPLAGRVVDERGQPVPGVRVRVTASDAFSESEVQIRAEAKTAADGTFSMPDAPAGPRSLEVRSAGFVLSSRFQLEPRSDQRFALKRGGTIRGVVLDAAGKPAAGALVRSGEMAVETKTSGAFRLPGIEPGSRTVEASWREDFAARKGAVRVARGEEIGATLRLARAAALAGRVVDEATRRPVAGARVEASSDGSLGYGSGQTERSTRTDAGGRFRLGGLASREYTVEATRRGYLAASLKAVAGVSPHGTANLALPRAASISGRVVDEAGGPVAGARVRLAQDRHPRALMRGQRAFLAGERGALSGPEGSFRLRDLAPGRNLLLEAVRKGFVTARRPGVTLKAGENLAKLTLMTRKGLEARGSIVDTQGGPVAGAEIRVTRREANEGFVGRQFRIGGLPQEKPDAVSGRDGTFVVRGLEEGEYRVSAAREGFASKTAPGLEVRPRRDNVWPPITLASGVAISGSVRGSKGEPIPAAEIVAHSMGGGSSDQNGVTDLEGRFRFEGFAPEGAVFLNVYAEGYGSAQKTVTAPANDVSVVLKAAGTLRGKVEDGDTKRPVTNFTVAELRRGGDIFRLSGSEGQLAVQSEEGVFELSGVPPGKWTIRVSAPGYRTGEISAVEVREGETKEGISFSIYRGGFLEGRVLDVLRGGGVPNASVSWRPTGDSTGMTGTLFARMGAGTSGSETTTDADGRFRFDGLPDARLTLTADHPDFLEGSRDVESAKDRSVDIPLGAGGAISGSVMERDGRTPAAGALVSLNEQGNSGLFGGGESTRTDAAGAFLFEHLDAGRFQLTAQTGNGRTTARDVVLAANQREDGVLLVFRSSGARVLGRVSGLPPEKLGGLAVSVSADDFYDDTQTDDAGHFTFHDVPPGAVRLSAMTGLFSGRTASKTAEVPEGGGEVPVEIVFEAGSRLSGRVTRADEPLSGLFVFAAADPPRTGGGRGNGQTDENGQYALDGLSDGSYQLSVYGPGITYRKVITVSGDTTADVSLSAVVISGRITEEGSGDPIEGATVQAQTGTEAAPFGIKAAVSDSAGHYELDGIDPGAYQVTARKPGYERKTRSATVGSDPVQADFALARGTGLTIRVTDGLTGLPLHGLSVVAFSADGTAAFQGSVRLDSAGTGEVSSLGPGRYSIHFFSDGYASRLLNVDVPSPPVSLGLTPGGRVQVRTETSMTGRIVDGSGATHLLTPWRFDARVSAQPPVTTWNNLAPGSYRFVATGPEGEKSFPFTVSEGQTTELELR